jgi:hypothetical protein
MLFNVYYAIITPESAEIGDADEMGVLYENLRLRDAMQEVFRTRTNAVGGISGIEANCCYSDADKGWLKLSPACTVYNGMEFKTGAHENRSITPAGKITVSSWRRLCRLMGA